MALISDRSVPRIAAELGVSVNNLRSWKREYQLQGRLLVDEEEIHRFRRELEWVEQERDIQKNAVGIFSQWLN